jgi:sporulation protein YlmC with PRC-barrel domain
MRNGKRQIAEAPEYVIGDKVECADRACGRLTRVVIDPVTRTLTHLIVAPLMGTRSARLVPVELAAATASGVRLRCTGAEFDALEQAEETQFLPGAAQGWGYGQHQMLSWPYYGLSGSGHPNYGMGAGFLGTAPAAASTTSVDRVPAGEIEIRRGDTAHATDGDIGRVHGFVVDPADHHITHVLLSEGHLWGHKNVAIPMSAVASVKDGVQLNLTKDQVRDLPDVNLDADPAPDPALGNGGHR